MALELTLSRSSTHDVDSALTPPPSVSLPLDLQAWERLARAVLDAKAAEGEAVDDGYYLRVRATMWARKAFEDFNTPERILGLIAAAQQQQQQDQLHSGTTMNFQTQAPELSQDATWVVWSFEHNAWWAANRCGYTTALLNAGLYTEADAREIEEGSTYGPVRREEARSLASVLEAEARKGWHSPKVLDLIQRALLPERAPAIAVDPSRSSPDDSALTPPIASPESSDHA